MDRKDVWWKDVMGCMSYVRTSFNDLGIEYNPHSAYERRDIGGDDSNYE